MNKYGWLVFLILFASIMSTGVYFGGYNRSDDVSSVPCLGCLGLNPVLQTQFRYESKGAHPDFVLDALDQNVVFLHYRTDVCSACDEMEPVIDEIEDEYTQVKFFHINLDHSEGEKRSSFFTYDIKGEGNDITGVPMFVILTKNMDSGEMKPYFKVMYGIHPKEDITSDLDTALDMYPSSEEFIPMVDLFVDENCKYCPNSEEALVDMYGEDDVYFVSYVTDADGESGNFSTYLENVYMDRYGDAGHPRAEFNGGEARKIGGQSNLVDEYGNITDKLNTSALPVKFSLDMVKSSQGYKIGYNIQSQVDGEYKLRILIADRFSPWKNIKDEPIPFAFVDNVFNQTIELQKGTMNKGNKSWSGTDEISYQEFGSDLCLFGLIYKDDAIVQTAHVPPEVKGISLETQDDNIPISPSGNRKVKFSITNNADSESSINLTSNDDLGWGITHVDSLDIEPRGNGTFTTIVSCPIDASIGSKNIVEINAEVIGQEHLSQKATVTFEVKEDSKKPQISSVKVDPEEPEKGERVEVQALVIDNEGIEKVEIQYYVCTDLLCAPTKTAVMNKTGKTYTANIGPFDEKFTYLHIEITATDVNGNTNQTQDYEIILQEKETDGEDTPLTITPLLLSLTVSFIIFYTLGKKFDSG